MARNAMFEGFLVSVDVVFQRWQGSKQKLSKKVLKLPKAQHFAPEIYCFWFSCSFFHNLLKVFLIRTNVPQVYLKYKRESKDLPLSEYSQVEEMKIDGDLENNAKWKFLFYILTKDLFNQIKILNQHVLVSDH